MPPPDHPLFPPPGWLPLCTCGCGMHQLRLHNLPLLGGQAGRWKLGIGEFVIMPHHSLSLWQGTNSLQPKFPCVHICDASQWMLVGLSMLYWKICIERFLCLTGDGSRWTINELLLGPSGLCLISVDFWNCWVFGGSVLFAPARPSPLPTTGLAALVHLQLWHASAADAQPPIAWRTSW